MPKSIITFAILWIATVLILPAQDHQKFYNKSLMINKSGMYFLGGWAVANMTTGVYGWLNDHGERKYFHQMNAAWNVVNAGIATYAAWEAFHTDIKSLSNDEIMRKHIRTENIYLFNAGLDVLYVAGGFWLIHASQNNEKHHDLLKGYGQSVILQGAFLFVFDLVKFGLQYNHRLKFNSASANVRFSAEGISFVYAF